MFFLFLEGKLRLQRRKTTVCSTIDLFGRLLYYERSLQFTKQRWSFSFRRWLRYMQTHGMFGMQYILHKALLSQVRSCKYARSTTSITRQDQEFNETRECWKQTLSLNNSWLLSRQRTYTLDKYYNTLHRNVCLFIHNYR